MRAHSSLLFCLFLGIQSTDSSIRSTTISCPSDYFDGEDGSCYFVSSNVATRNDAFNQCTQKGAYLVDSNSAAQNEQIQNWSKQLNKSWIGLICTSNDLTSCVWDETKVAITNSSYTNFAQGSLNASIGSCVILNVLTGQWESNDCTVNNFSYICKFTPTIEATSPASTTPASAICDSKSSYENNGTIYSPGYPNGMNSTSCAYMISVNGSDNYVQIYFSDIGIYAGSKLEFSACNNCTPFKTLAYQYKETTIYFPSNVIFMIFTSTYNDGSHWIANYGSYYSPQCPRSMNYTGSGWISSPSDLNSSLSCEYLITVAHNQAGISFSTLLLNSGSRLEFYSDMTSKTPFRTLLSPAQQNGVLVVSPTNMIRMYYYSNYLGGSNWVGYYNYYNQSQICPRRMNYTGSGSISAPSGLYSNLSCEYLITVEQGLAEITFSTLLLKSGSRLEFYSDMTSLTPFRTLFDRNDGATIASPTKMIRMYYNSSYMDGSNWVGYYDFYNPMCQVPMNYTGNGSITSPSGLYSSLSCEYLITVEQGLAEITFSTLLLNSGSRLEFYSDMTSRNPFQTLYNRYSSVIVASPTKMIRMYYNSSSMDGSKWEGYYDSYTPICQVPMNYTGTGTISSPDTTYSSGKLRCKYLITAEQNQLLQINFMHIYLSDGDQLAFYSDLYNSTPFEIIDHNTYSYVKPFISPTNMIRMVYNTTSSSSSYWTVQYGPYTPICQVPMNYTGNGTIFSPDTTYSSGNLRCEYLITVEQNQVLQMNFTYIYLRSGDQIAFYSDLYSSTPFEIIDKNTYYYVKPFISPTNMIRMVYNTTPDSYSKWTAQYGLNNLYKKCPLGVPYNYTGNGTVSSPNYPIGSVINNNCEYIINSGNENLSVQIYLSWYDFFQNSSLKIYDDSSSSGLLLETFNSATNYYYKIVSPTDTLRLVYNTQADGSYWTGTYSTIPTCNSQNFYKGTITSPNYPDLYPKDADRNCTYSLDSMQNVTCISFDQIYINQDTYIHVFDGPAWGKEIVAYNYTTSLNSYTDSNATLQMCTQINRVMTVVFQISWSYNSNANGFIARFAGSLDDLKNLADGNSAISLLLLIVYNYL